MASFNGKAFEKKLKEMDASQTSIQTVSLWIIHHRQVGKQVVGAWANFMKKSKPERRLLLLYLANDVVQNGRKKAKELIQLFGKTLKDCMQLLADPSIKNSVGRVLNIWEERKIYDKDFISKLRTVVAGKTEKSEHPKGSKKPKVTKEIPPDYKLSKVINGIRHMKDLESSISKKTSQLSLLKVDASDLEAVKQVKDRFGVDKFCKEFEESRAKLEDYCNTLSRCLNDKRVLVTTLQGCDAFYEAATEEANIIVTAYKTFGNRLISMKKKLNSKVRKIEEKNKRQQKKLEEDQEEDTVGSVESEKEKEKTDESQESKTEGVKKDRSESVASSTPLTSDDVTPTPTGEEDGDQKDEDEDNTKVEDMELDSDSDAEVSSGEGPLYDPTSAGHGFEETGIVKTEVDTGVPDTKESEPIVPEAYLSTEKLPVQEDPFSALANLPGLAALKTGMMTALPLTQVDRSPSLSPASDFAPSPEGTPEDLVLQDETHPVINLLPSASGPPKPLAQGMTFDSLFTEDASEASLEQPLGSTLGASSAQATIAREASGSVSVPSNKVSIKFDLLTHPGQQANLVPVVTTKGNNSPAEHLSYSATRTSQSFVDQSSKPARYEDTMLTFSSQPTWGRNVPLPHEPVSAQHGTSGLAPSSAATRFHGLEYSSDARPVGPGVSVADQNAKVVIAEDILAEAENAPSPAPSGGSTPTQDERLETPVVRPMDVLTQLINRARGLQDSLKGPEMSHFSKNDHPKPTSGIPPANRMDFGSQGMSSVGNAQPYVFNNPPPVLSPGPPRGFPPISASSSFIPNPGSGYLNRYDAPLLPSESFGDLQSSSSSTGGVKPYHEGLEGSQLPLPLDDRPLPFTKFPMFDQIEIVKAQGPNGVFLDEGTSLMHQAARLDEGDSRMLQDGVGLSPRTQFLQGASSKDVDASSSSDESVGKHHRSRKRSSRSKDRSPRHRSSKHKDSVAKHKEGSKHRERSPKHRSPKRRERHHSPKQKERSPKHSSKRRKHSNSKGRDSHSPDREKYPSLRRRDRSPSLELSRSSNEDVFYNDRRSPTPELDSLPVRTPVSPRNVRSFESLPNTQAPNLDLNLGTPQLPMFSPSTDLLLPSPSAPSAFGQGYQGITPTLPSLGPPHGPFIGTADPNQNTGINDSPVQPRIPLEQASVSGQPISQPTDPGLLGPPSFNRQLSDGRFPHHDHARQDHLESRYPMQLKPQTVVHDSRGAPMTPEIEPTFQEPHEKQQMNSANLPFFSRSHEVVNSKVSIDPGQPKKRSDLEPSPSYAGHERSEDTHSHVMPGNEELRGSEAIHQQNRASLPHLGRQPLERTPDHIFEDRHQFVSTAPIRPRPPLESPFQQPPPRHQGGRHRFGLARMPRPDHNEVRFEHPAGQSEMRFRPRNEGGEPRFHNRGEPFSPRFPPRHEFLDPRFSPRNDFHPRLEDGLGFRKGFPRYQGHHPPRGPRMPPNRFPRQPFPRGPDRPFAPRGPVY